MVLVNGVFWWFMLFCVIVLLPSISAEHTSYKVICPKKDCEEALDPFDITRNDAVNGLKDSKKLDTPPGDMFRDVTGESNIKKITEIRENGYYTSLCWIEITTITETKNGSKSALREYAITFETPSDIPDKYVDNKTNTDSKESVQYKIFDRDTKKSEVVNFSTISKSDDITVRQNRKVLCGSGPIYTKEFMEWPHSERKRVEIRVSPKKQNLIATDCEILNATFEHLATPSPTLRDSFGSTMNSNLSSDEMKPTNKIDSKKVQHITPSTIGDEEGHETTIPSNLPVTSIIKFTTPKPTEIRKTNSRTSPSESNNDGLSPKSVTSSTHLPTKQSIFDEATTDIVSKLTMPSTELLVTGYDHTSTETTISQQMVTKEVKTYHRYSDMPSKTHRPGKVGPISLSKTTKKPKQLQDETKTTTKSPLAKHSDKSHLELSLAKHDNPKEEDISTTPPVDGHSTKTAKTPKINEKLETLGKDIEKGVTSTNRPVDGLSTRSEHTANLKEHTEEEVTSTKRTIDSHSTKIVQTPKINEEFETAYKDTEEEVTSTKRTIDSHSTKIVQTPKINEKFETTYKDTEEEVTSTKRTIDSHSTKIVQTPKINEEFETTYKDTEEEVSSTKRTIDSHSTKIVQTPKINEEFETTYKDTEEEVSSTKRTIDSHSTKIVQTPKINEEFETTYKDTERRITSTNRPVDGPSIKSEPKIKEHTKEEVTSTKRTIDSHSTKIAQTPKINKEFETTDTDIEKTVTSTSRPVDSLSTRSQQTSKIKEHIGEGVTTTKRTIVSHSTKIAQTPKIKGEFETTNQDIDKGVTSTNRPVEGLSTRSDQTAKINEHTEEDVTSTKRTIDSDSTSAQTPKIKEQFETTYKDIERRMTSTKRPINVQSTKGGQTSKIEEEFETTKEDTEKRVTSTPKIKEKAEATKDDTEKVLTSSKLPTYAESTERGPTAKIKEEFETTKEDTEKRGTSTPKIKEKVEATKDDTEKVLTSNKLPTYAESTERGPTTKIKEEFETTKEDTEKRVTSTPKIKEKSEATKDDTEKVLTSSKLPTYAESTERGPTAKIKEEFETTKEDTEKRVTSTPKIKEKAEATKDDTEKVLTSSKLPTYAESTERGPTAKIKEEFETTKEDTEKRVTSTPKIKEKSEATKDDTEKVLTSSQLPTYAESTERGPTAKIKEEFETTKEDTEKRVTSTPKIKEKAEATKDDTEKVLTSSQLPTYAESTERGPTAKIKEEFETTKEDTEKRVTSTPKIKEKAETTKDDTEKVLTSSKLPTYAESTERGPTAKIKEKFETTKEDTEKRVTSTPKIKEKAEATKDDTEKVLTSSKLPTYAESTERGPTAKIKEEFETTKEDTEKRVTSTPKIKEKAEATKDDTEKVLTSSKLPTYAESTERGPTAKIKEEFETTKEDTEKRGTSTPKIKEKDEATKDDTEKVLTSSKLPTYAENTERGPTAKIKEEFETTKEDTEKRVTSTPKIKEKAEATKDDTEKVLTSSQLPTYAESTERGPTAKIKEEFETTKEDTEKRVTSTPKIKEKAEATKDDTEKVLTSSKLPTYAESTERGPTAKIKEEFETTKEDTEKRVTSTPKIKEKSEATKDDTEKVLTSSQLPTYAESTERGPTAKIKEEFETTKEDTEKRGTSTPKIKEKDEATKDDTEKVLTSSKLPTYAESTERGPTAKIKEEFETTKEDTEKRGTSTPKIKEKDEATKDDTEKVLTSSKLPTYAENTERGPTAKIKEEFETTKEDTEKRVTSTPKIKEKAEATKDDTEKVLTSSQLPTYAESTERGPTTKIKEEFETTKEDTEKRVTSTPKIKEKSEATKDDTEKVLTSSKLPTYAESTERGPTAKIKEEFETTKEDTEKRVTSTPKIKEKAEATKDDTEKVLTSSKLPTYAESTERGPTAKIKEEFETTKEDTEKRVTSTPKIKEKSEATKDDTEKVLTSSQLPTYAESTERGPTAKIKEEFETTKEDTEKRVTSTPKIKEKAEATKDDTEKVLTSSQLPTYAESTERGPTAKIKEEFETTKEDTEKRVTSTPKIKEKAETTKDDTEKVLTSSKLPTYAESTERGPTAKIKEKFETTKEDTEKRVTSTPKIKEKAEATKDDTEKVLTSSKLPTYAESTERGPTAKIKEEFETTKEDTEKRVTSTPKIKEKAEATKDDTEKVLTSSKLPTYAESTERGPTAKIKEEFETTKEDTEKRGTSTPKIKEKDEATKDDTEKVLTSSKLPTYAENTERGPTAKIKEEFETTKEDTEKRVTSTPKIKEKAEATKDDTEKVLTSSQLPTYAESTERGPTAKIKEEFETTKEDTEKRVTSTPKIKEKAEATKDDTEKVLTSSKLPTYAESTERGPTAKIKEEFETTKEDTEKRVTSTPKIKEKAEATKDDTEKVLTSSKLPTYAESTERGPTAKIKEEFETTKEDTEKRVTSTPKIKEKAEATKDDTEKVLTSSQLPTYAESTERGPTAKIKEEFETTKEDTEKRVTSTPKIKEKAEATKDDTEKVLTSSKLPTYAESTERGPTAKIKEEFETTKEDTEKRVTSTPKIKEKAETTKDDTEKVLASSKLPTYAESTERGPTAKIKEEFETTKEDTEKRVTSTPKIKEKAEATKDDTEKVLTSSKLSTYAESTERGPTAKIKEEFETTKEDTEKRGTSTPKIKEKDEATKDDTEKVLTSSKLPTYAESTERGPTAKIKEEFETTSEFPLGKHTANYILESSSTEDYRFSTDGSSLAPRVVVAKHTTILVPTTKNHRPERVTYKTSEYETSTNIVPDDTSKKQPTVLGHTSVTESATDVHSLADHKQDIGKKKNSTLLTSLPYKISKTSTGSLSTQKPQTRNIISAQDQNPETTDLTSNAKQTQSFTKHSTTTESKLEKLKPNVSNPTDEGLIDYYYGTTERPSGENIVLDKSPRNMTAPDSESTTVKRKPIKYVEAGNQKEPSVTSLRESISTTVNPEDATFNTINTEKSYQIKTEEIVSATPFGIDNITTRTRGLFERSKVTPKGPNTEGETSKADQETHLKEITKTGFTESSSIDTVSKHSSYPTTETSVSKFTIGSSSYIKDEVPSTSDATIKEVESQSITKSPRSTTIKDRFGQEKLVTPTTPKEDTTQELPEGSNPSTTEGSEDSFAEIQVQNRSSRPSDSSQSSKVQVQSTTDSQNENIKETTSVTSIESSSESDSGDAFHSKSTEDSVISTSIKTEVKDDNQGPEIEKDYYYTQIFTSTTTKLHLVDDTLEKQKSVKETSTEPEEKEVYESRSTMQVGRTSTERDVDDDDIYPESEDLKHLDKDHFTVKRFRTSTTIERATKSRDENVQEPTTTILNHFSPGARKSGTTGIYPPTKSTQPEANKQEITMDNVAETYTHGHPSTTTISSKIYTESRISNQTDSEKDLSTPSRKTYNFTTSKFTKKPQHLEYNESNVNTPKSLDSRSQVKSTKGDNLERTHTTKLVPQMSSRLISQSEDTETEAYETSTKSILSDLSSTAPQGFTTANDENSPLTSDITYSRFYEVSKENDSVLNTATEMDTYGITTTTDFKFTVTSDGTADEPSSIKIYEHKSKTESPKVFSKISHTHEGMDVSSPKSLIKSTSSSTDLIESKFTNILYGLEASSSTTSPKHETPSDKYPITELNKLYHSTRLPGMIRTHQDASEEEIDMEVTTLAPISSKGKSSTIHTPHLVSRNLNSGEYTTTEIFYTASIPDVWSSSKEPLPTLFNEDEAATTKRLSESASFAPIQTNTMLTGSEPITTIGGLPEQSTLETHGIDLLFTPQLISTTIESDLKYSEFEGTTTSVEETPPSKGFDILCNNTKQKVLVKVKILMEHVLEGLEDENGSNLQAIVPILGIEKKAEFDIKPISDEGHEVPQQELDKHWDKFLDDLAHNFFSLNKDKVPSFDELLSKSLNLSAPENDFEGEVLDNDESVKRMQIIRDSIKPCKNKTQQKSLEDRTDNPEFRIDNLFMPLKKQRTRLHNIHRKLKTEQQQATPDFYRYLLGFESDSTNKEFDNVRPTKSLVFGLKNAGTTKFNDWPHQNGPAMNQFGFYAPEYRRYRPKIELPKQYPPTNVFPVSSRFGTYEDPPNYMYSVLRSKPKIYQSNVPVRNEYSFLKNFGPVPLNDAVPPYMLYDDVEPRNNNPNTFLKGDSVSSFRKEFRVPNMPLQREIGDWPVARIDEKELNPDNSQPSVPNIESAVDPRISLNNTLLFAAREQPTNLPNSNNKVGDFASVLGALTSKLSLLVDKLSNR